MSFETLTVSLLKKCFLYGDKNLPFNLLHLYEENFSELCEGYKCAFN